MLGQHSPEREEKWGASQTRAFDKIQSQIPDSCRVRNWATSPRPVFENYNPQNTCIRMIGDACWGNHNRTS